MPPTPPPLTPGAIFVLVIIALVVVTGTLMVIFKASVWLAERRENMSSSGRVRSVPLPSVEPVYSAFPPRETNLETGETAARMASEQEKILFAENYAAEVVARLILDDKIGLTDVIKIGFVAKSGAKYQKHSALVKAAMDRQRQPQFPDPENGGRVPASYPVSGRR